MKLRTPLVPSASPLSHNIDTIRLMEDKGASAIVLYSLFEEQLTFESHQLDHYLSYGIDSFAEATSYFPDMETYKIGPDEYLNLIHQAARVLAPGGALVIETPNPGNVLMAAEQFWLDATHQRPIPMPLMEFVFEYCGFRVIHRFEVNPRPESEHLPFRELELAKRLDQLLYGPQDYAVMGRRD